MELERVLSGELAHSRKYLSEEEIRNIDECNTIAYTEAPNVPRL